MHLNTKLKIWLVGALLALTVPGTLFAQGLTGDNSSGQQVFCKRDFSSFISTGLDFGGQGFTEYWKDFLVRYSANYCHYSDIDNLLRRIDKARKQLRQAFYACDTNTSLRVAAQYRKMSVELYFLRNYFKIKASVRGDFSDEVKEGLVRVRPNFRDQFLDKFQKYVNKGYYTNQQLRDLYVEFQNKYEPKLETYRNCTDPNLDLLMIKFEELKNTFDTIKQMGQSFAERTSEKAKQTQERVNENPGLVGGAVQAAIDKKSVGEYFKNAVELRINNQDSKTFWEETKAGENDLAREFRENTPGIDSSPYRESQSRQARSMTVDDVYEDLNVIRGRDQYKNLDITYMAKIDSKYRQTGDQGLNLAVNKLDELIGIIKETYPELNKLQSCAARIKGNQCSNK